MYCVGYQGKNNDIINAMGYPYYSVSYDLLKVYNGCVDPVLYKRQKKTFFEQYHVNPAIVP